MPNYNPIASGPVYAEQYTYEQHTPERFQQAARDFGITDPEIQKHIQHRLDNTGYGAFVILTQNGLIFSVPSDYFEYAYKAVDNE